MHYNRLAGSTWSIEPFHCEGGQTVVYDILDGCFGISHALFSAPLAQLVHTFTFQIGPEYRDGQVKSPIDCQCIAFSHRTRAHVFT